LHGHGGGGELPKNSATAVGDGTVGVARRLRGLGTNGSELTSEIQVSSSTSILFGRRKGSGGCSFDLLRGGPSLAVARQQRAPAELDERPRKMKTKN